MKNLSDISEHHILLSVHNASPQSFIADVSIGATRSIDQPAIASFRTTFPSISYLEGFKSTNDLVEMLAQEVSAQPQIASLLWDMSRATPEVRAGGDVNLLTHEFVSLILDGIPKDIPPTQRLSLPLFQGFRPPYDNAFYSDKTSF